LSEAKLRRLGFGLELSSIEGLKTSAYWLHRNALGGAERFRIEGEVAGIGGETGGIDYRLAASLGIPAVLRTDTELLLTASLSREDEPDYLIDKFSVTGTLTRVVNDRLSTSAGVGLLRAREETGAGVRAYTLLTAPLNGTYDRRDNATNSKNGYYLDLDVTPFVSLEGSANGARVFADARGFASFGAQDQFSLAARGQIGAVFGPTRAQAPADFLFFSGGGGTVRGQGYKSLGVTDGTDTTGGLSFLGTQLEARYDVTESIGIVGFVDAGMVGADADPFGASDWHSGAGIGLRYNTGIGPIRLDVATPASGPARFGSVDVYIGIGQAF
jgi:translocation and assembly module TamA